MMGEGEGKRFEKFLINVFLQILLFLSKIDTFQEENSTKVILKSKISKKLFPSFIILMKLHIKTISSTQFNIFIIVLLGDLTRYAAQRILLILCMKLGYYMASSV